MSVGPAWRRRGTFYKDEQVMTEERERCEKLKSLLQRVLDSYVNGRRVREGIDISLRRECEWEEETE
jgi:hypothetical protein